MNAALHRFRIILNQQLFVNLSYNSYSKTWPAEQFRKFDLSGHLFVFSSNENLCCFKNGEQHSKDINNNIVVLYHE